MKTKFEQYINEGVTNKQLLDNLQGAKFLQVEYNSAEHGWGVKYSKNGEIFTQGKFNTNADVHNFLIENDIDYGGKEGYLFMKKYRDKQVKIPFSNYQQELLKNGIDDML